VKGQLPRLGENDAIESQPTIGRERGSHDETVTSNHAVKQQTLPEALKYVWQGYPTAKAKN
jgi:hypothetical protein